LSKLQSTTLKLAPL